jgi:hypothetical protein
MGPLLDRNPNGVVTTVTGAGAWCGCAERVQVAGGAPPWCRPGKRAVRGEVEPTAAGATVDAMAACEISAAPTAGTTAGPPPRACPPAVTRTTHLRQASAATTIVSWSLTGTAPVQGATDGWVRRPESIVTRLAPAQLHPRTTGCQPDAAMDRTMMSKPAWRKGTLPTFHFPAKVSIKLVTRRSR